MIKQGLQMSTMRHYIKKFNNIINHFNDLM